MQSSLMMPKACLKDAIAFSAAFYGLLADAYAVLKVPLNASVLLRK